MISHLFLAQLAFDVCRRLQGTQKGGQDVNLQESGSDEMVSHLMYTASLPQRTWTAWRRWVPRATLMTSLKCSNSCWRCLCEPRKGKILGGGWKRVKSQNYQRMSKASATHLAKQENGLVDDVHQGRQRQRALQVHVRAQQKQNVVGQLA